MNISIHSRILFSAFIILILFMGLTGIVLDSAFRANTKNLQQENLRTQIYTLLATAELDENNNLYLPAEITEPRLNAVESTLFARVSSDNKTIWRSKSTLNLKLPKNEARPIGQFNFSDINIENQSFTLLSFSTVWVTEQGERTYYFQIAENNVVIDNQNTLFRKNLWFWLSGVSLLLIIIQTLILRWGLKPLRQVAESLLNIEHGTELRLKTSYPKEINPLAINLNRLLDQSEQQLKRYREALGNMAHSLKTPIAVLQGILTTEKIQQKDIAKEQLFTINDIVDYQLQRASNIGQVILGKAILLKPIVTKIVSSLEKVHKEKNIETSFFIADDFSIKFNEGDLFELLGNLIENAFKWSNKKIKISASKKNNNIQLIIEDDGPGINKEKYDDILLRGQRADQSIPGHGLGLAMVKDILLLYKGSIRIEKSELNGAKIIIAI